MRKLFTLGALAFWTVVQIGNVSAQPSNLQIRGNTNLERAMNNRATLLERANVQLRGPSQSRVEINSRNTVELRTNATTRGNGRTSRTLPSVGTERLTPGLIRRTAEAERMREIRGRVRAEGEVSRRNETPAPEHRESVPRSQERREIVQARAEVLGNTSLADRLLVKRLAQIDHMRDIALENGNERQLEQADKLEQLARWQFEHRFEARANNPFAEVTPETAEEAELTHHPFRPNGNLAPTGEHETNTTVETETTTTVNP